MLLLLTDGIPSPQPSGAPTRARALLATRAADSLDIPADRVATHHGSTIIWFAPQYGPSAAVGTVPLFDAGAIRIEYLAGASSLRCTAGDVIGIVPLATRPGVWVAAACAWDDTGLVTASWDDQWHAANVAGDATGAAPDEPVQPAPLWARIDEVRLYDIALTEAQIRAYVESTSAAHR